MNITQNVRNLTAARDAGDANLYAQLQIEIYGLESARKFWNPARVAQCDGYKMARPGFYSDVATLLRLETASDEGAE